MHCCFPISLNQRQRSPSPERAASTVPMLPRQAIPTATSRSKSVESPRSNAKSLLCLKCREPGHVAARCKYRGWHRNEFSWFLSEKRKRMSFGDPAHILEHHLCGRCQDLNILEFLNKDLPWELTSELNARAQKGTNTFQSLGKTGSTEFWNDCALCLCLFALTPNPSSPDQDIFLLTDWSMNRLAGETDTITDLDGWGQFPKCLLITLSDDDSSIQQQFSTQLHRGDALCVVQEDDPSHCLAGRIIDPKALNINIIQDWLRTCDNLHTFKCSPSWTQEIPDLKLVDVTTRTIVKPPTHSFQYLALSYVWGGVHQHAYQLGSKLADLPAVIDDAIHFTRLLGKQYL